MDDLRFLVEFEDFPVVHVDAVDKLLEGLEAEAFFFDDCDDCIAFAAVGVKCTWREGGGGIELYVIGRVGGRGGVHCACKNADC